MTTCRLPSVTIYTDGACEPNPGPGGWAAILLRDPSGPERLSGAEDQTTNNRMELRAAIEGLRALSEPHQVVLMTDSQYLCNGAAERLPEWERAGWPADQTKVKNLELWRELAEVLRGHHVEWRWVRGHAGNRWNAEADALAQSMLPRDSLPLNDETAIHVFTGASCAAAGNGPAGWGVVLRYRTHEKPLSGGEPFSSSNRMHLLGALRGLEAITKPLIVHLYTTSEYLRRGITSWVEGWRRRGWKTEEGQSVQHRDLWEPLFELSVSLKAVCHVLREIKQCPQMAQARSLAVEAARKAAVSAADNGRMGAS